MQLLGQGARRLVVVAAQILGDLTGPATLLLWGISVEVDTRLMDSSQLLLACVAQKIRERLG